MLKFVVILFFLVTSMQDLLTESDGVCDLVEINHCHDPKTHKLLYTQLIAWDWFPDYKRYNVQQWILVNDWKRVSGGVVADAEGKNLIVRLRCDFYRETWTNHDPERSNQKLFDVKYRRKVFECGR